MCIKSFLAFLCIVNGRIREAIGKKIISSNFKMKQQKRIVLKGQKYATPKTESVEIKSQGVLCGSVAVGLNVKSGALG